MPLSETVEYRELNDFLQKSLSSKKDESSPNITLNSLEVKNLFRIFSKIM
ncbi:hypothetical protein [Spiroplasma endosymbiont of Cleonymus obscurus]